MSSRVEKVEYAIGGKPLIYRIGKIKFVGIIPAECYRIDNRDWSPIEIFYKGRWHFVGDRPEPLRVAL